MIISIDEFKDLVDNHLSNDEPTYEVNSGFNILDSMLSKGVDIEDL